MPAKLSFSISQHLAWGDVAVDSIDKPTVVKVQLKISNKGAKGWMYLYGEHTIKFAQLLLACLILQFVALVQAHFFDFRMAHHLPRQASCGKSAKF